MNEEIQQLLKEIENDGNRWDELLIEAQRIRADIDKVEFSVPEDFEPYQRGQAVARPEVKRTFHINPMRILRLGLPVLFVLILGLGLFGAEKAQAYGGKCDGDGMTPACTACILQAVDKESSEQAQECEGLSRYDNVGPLDTRYNLLKANEKTGTCGGFWNERGPTCVLSVSFPVTKKQHDAWSQPTFSPTPEPEVSRSDESPGQETVLQPATSYSYAEPGMDARTKWAIGIVLGFGLLLAFKQFAPTAYATSTGRVSAMHSTVKPHAHDFGAGLRKFLPGIYWLFRFEDFKTFLVKMVVLLFGCFMVFSVLFDFLGTWLSLLFVVTVVFGLGRLDTAKVQVARVESDRWWEPAEFTKALIAAGIVAKPKAGAPQPVSLPSGPPRANPYGTEAKFDLPGALTAADVNKKIGALAKALKVPASRLLVDQGKADPEGTVTVWVGTGKGEGVQLARTPEPDRHDATRPFVVGRTVKGEPIEIRTANRQTLLAGQPGQGKTFLARRIVLHFLADPKGRTYVIDAKGDDDYVDGQEAYSAYVTTASGDQVMLANVEKVLTHIFGVMNDHNARRKANVNPTLLVLEEWWSVLATADEHDKALRKRIDYLMQEVTKKGRSANIHVLLISQEMRDESISAKIRAMFQQAMAFALASPGEQRMVFGSPLTVRPAVEEGEVNLKVNGRQYWVRADLLGSDEWVSAVNEMTPRDPLTLTEVTPLDPLTLAVLEVTQEHGDVEPQALWDLLPEGLRTGTPPTLGKALGKVGIQSEMVGGRRVYRPAAVQAAVQKG